MIPYEDWTNEKLDLSHLRVFGSILHAKKPGVIKGKLDTSLITRRALLGYTPTSRNATQNGTISREKNHQGTSS